VGGPLLTDHQLADIKAAVAAQCRFSRWPSLSREAAYALLGEVERLRAEAARAERAVKLLLAVFERFPEVRQWYRTLFDEAVRG
jgi:hypothetical protein